MEKMKARLLECFIESNSRRFNMDGMLFLLYAPMFCAVLGFIGGMISLIMTVCSSSKSTKTSTHHNYSQTSSYCDYPDPDYDTVSKVLLETEMKAHNARMEQMLQAQNKILIDNELRRISDSIQTPLADQLDSRLTNIFKNPWEGIL